MVDDADGLGGCPCECWDPPRVCFLLVVDDRTEKRNLLREENLGEFVVDDDADAEGWGNLEALGLDGAVDQAAAEGLGESL